MLAGKRGTRPGWMRLAGQGIELAAAVLGFAGVGYWLGGHFGSALWGLIIGASLGVLGGLYNLVRVALRITREASSPQGGKPGGG